MTWLAGANGVWKQPLRRTATSDTNKSSGYVANVRDCDSVTECGQFADPRGRQRHFLCRQVRAKRLAQIRITNDCCKLSGVADSRYTLRLMRRWSSCRKRLAPCLTAYPTEHTSGGIALFRLCYGNPGSAVSRGGKGELVTMSGQRPIGGAMLVSPHCRHWSPSPRRQPSGRQRIDRILCEDKAMSTPHRRNC